MNIGKHLKRGLLVLSAALALQFYTKQEKYALVINGDDSIKYSINISQAYEAFFKNGFDKVYILDSKYENNFDKLLNANFEDFLVTNYPIYGTAKRKTLEEVINKLKNEVDKDALFFLYVTDHGNRIDEEIAGERIELSTITLYGEEDTTEEELFEILKPIKPKIGVYLFDQCYSGGFAVQFGHGNVIAIASAVAEKSSYSFDRNSVGYFFMKALAGDMVADSDENGRISIKEAFDYMMRRHTYSIDGDQKPFINSELDPSKVYIDE
ncbi:MAG: hypothetical protein KKA65_05345 [Nanoarchaeota archaeon]|nr:hypothetical protein [Nanoarchaeota archaeon]MBU4242381.1 hypothetical protein [Nanoarchaeota archaeon]MBU4352782.1 hypothetical protein [Nanoarchaeota archaeon]MBU4456897.1 hypothetical protein [Nanoarchaeota archaeon]